MNPTWLDVLLPLIPQVEEATGLTCALRLGEPPDDGWLALAPDGGCGSSWVAVIQGDPTPQGCDALLQVQLGFTMCGAPTLNERTGVSPTPEAETEFSSEVLRRAEALKAVVHKVGRRWVAVPRPPGGDYAGWSYTVSVPVY